MLHHYACYGQLYLRALYFDYRVDGTKPYGYCMSLRGAFHLFFTNISYMVVVGEVFTWPLYQSFYDYRVSYAVGRGYDSIFGCTSLMLVLWAFSRTYFPIFWVPKSIDCLYDDGI